jgi:hypothetical protein
VSGVNIAWLDDQVLALYAQAGSADPAIWAQRYDPSCPSDFYRGYATILLRVRNEFHSNPNLGALRRQIDAYDQAIQALPADERRNGASFALMNIASYAQGGTPEQISATLAPELICIAGCFGRNRAAGL